MMKEMKRFLLAVAVVLLMPAFATAKVYLVSVGIADYPGTERDLTLPAKDAQTITWLYSKNTSLQYCQLLDAEATKAKIVAAMNKVFSLAGVNDMVVFFYSGHGYPGGFLLTKVRNPTMLIYAGEGHSKYRAYNTFDWHYYTSARYKNATYGRQYFSPHSKMTLSNIVHYDGSVRSYRYMALPERLAFGDTQTAAEIFK